MHLNKTVTFSGFHKSFKPRQYSKDRHSNSSSSFKVGYKRKHLGFKLKDVNSECLNMLEQDTQFPVIKKNLIKIEQEEDKKEYTEIVNTCLKLEEVVAVYEEKNAKMKLRIEELEKENLYLGKKLKESWKNKGSLMTDTKKSQEKILDKKNENLFVPVTSTGKYLKGLGDKYGPGSKEFYREIEGFLGYKEHKLNMTVGHFKSIISNLQVKLKKKNSECVNGMTVNSVGVFFMECVEDVKKVLMEKRNDGRVLVKDKLRILKRFLLDERILRMVYGKLMEDKIAEEGGEQYEVVPYEGDQEQLR